MKEKEREGKKQSIQVLNITHFEIAKVDIASDFLNCLT